MTGTERYLQQIENIQRHINDIQRAYAPLAQSIQLAQSSYVKFAQDFQQQIKGLMQSYIDWNNIIQRQFQHNMQPYYDTVNRIREYIDSVAKITGPISFFDAVREIQAEYERIEAMSATVDQDNAVDEYIEAIEIQARIAPKSALSLEFYIGLLYSLILYIASQNSSSESEAKIMARFDKIEASIATLGKQLEANERTEFYVVDRSAMLRATPDARSAVIAKMPIDLKVELLERKGKWVKVEFFSSKGSVMIGGWVLKKYLYRLEFKKQSLLSTSQWSGEGTPSRR